MKEKTEQQIEEEVEAIQTNSDGFITGITRTCL